MGGDGEEAQGLNFGAFQCLEGRRGGRSEPY